MYGVYVDIDAMARKEVTVSVCPDTYACRVAHHTAH
jgi:hypothetical protein